MSLGVFLAVLAAAFLHALWNALIKTGASKLGAMVIMSFAQVPFGLAAALAMPPIRPESAVWIAAACAILFFYKLFLTAAYARGDLSRVYPIARGGAPLLVALAGAFLLPDRLSAQEYLAIFILAAGVLVMARGALTAGEDRRLVPLALGTALATAGYTLVDGVGARISESPAGYVGWVFVFDGLLFGCSMVAVRGRAVLPRGLRAWAGGTLAAGASYCAYAVSVWAMTLAPIALVAALREAAILFAVLIGWLAFGERMRAEKLLGSVGIVAGLVLTRL